MVSQPVESGMCYYTWDVFNSFVCMNLMGYFRFFFLFNSVMRVFNREMIKGMLSIGDEMLFIQVARVMSQRRPTLGHEYIGC